MNPYQVFHSSHQELRRHLHIVIVRPENGGNLGSAARALENMGICGEFSVVGSPEIVNAECRKFAKHAYDRIEKICFFTSLKEALETVEPGALKMAATARVGSPHRPHPLRVREAMEKAIGKLKDEEIPGLQIVFGPESDGLTNEEIELCDWVVTIPSSSEYRSLNLAQAILIFCYEVQLNLMESVRKFENANAAQRKRLVTHLLQLAEEVGFILPGDPFKMRPRLEGIFSRLPRHIPEAKTLHGLLDQISRSLRKGETDFKGRYRNFVEQVSLRNEDGKA